MEKEWKGNGEVGVKGEEKEIRWGRNRESDYQTLPDVSKKGSATISTE